MSTRRLVIAIDGPAGAGKSTIAGRLARKFGYVNIETGAMYRALALLAIETGASPDDAAALITLMERSPIRLEPTPEGNRVLVGWRDVSARIRQQDVTEAASRVSVHPPVRERMVALQREMGLSGGVVMEGRDIGTKVFPDADVKIFLDASLDIRAKRRVQQQREKGIADSTTHTVEQMRERDHRDTTRAVSPLVPAADAHIIDSSLLGIEEVIAEAERLVAEKLAGGRTPGANLR